MSKETQKPIVILAEDDEGVAEALTGVLGRAGYEVKRADSVVSATMKIHALGRLPALLITDFGLKGDQTGEQLIYNARKEHPKLPVVMITGNSDLEEVRQALRQKNVDEHSIVILQKPYSRDELMVAIQDAKTAAAAISAQHASKAGGDGSLQRK